MSLVFWVLIVGGCTFGFSWVSNIEVKVVGGGWSDLEFLGGNKSIMACPF